MLKRKLVLTMVACLLLVWGCASLGIQTEEDAYIQAVTEYNSLGRLFLDQYKVQSPAVQAKWAKEIVPMILKVSAGLDAWGIARDMGTAIGNKQALALNLILELKNVLLATGAIQIK